MDLEVTRLCLWCGTELAPWFDGLYCSAAHKEKQRLHRRNLDHQPLETCPRPFKVAYTHRGDALRKAVEFSQRPYLCACGVFHLTSGAQWAGEPNKFEEALRLLAQEILPIGLSA